MLALASERGGGEYNVGSGEAASLREVAALMGELADVDLQPTYEGDRITVPPRVGDVTRARDELGFEASVGLREGLAGVLESMRSDQAAERAAASR